MSYIRFVELSTLALFLGMVLLLDMGRRLGRRRRARHGGPGGGRPGRRRGRLRPAGAARGLHLLGSGRPVRHPAAVDRRGDQRPWHCLPAAGPVAACRPASPPRVVPAVCGGAAGHLSAAARYCRGPSRRDQSHLPEPATRHRVAERGVAPGADDRRARRGRLVRLCFFWLIAQWPL